MIGTTKPYKPGGHCPAESCADGKRTQDLIRIQTSREMPTGVSLRESEALYRCPYCGLIWTQRASDSHGMLRRDESRAVGHKKIGKSFEVIPSGMPFTFDERHYHTDP